MNTTRSITSLDYSTRSQASSGGDNRRYHAYLLRIWREDEGTPWRLQIEDSRTHETVGFPTLIKLLAYLDDQIAEEEA
jgi:hypothetical protein